MEWIVFRQLARLQTHISLQHVGQFKTAAYPKHLSLKFLGNVGTPDRLSTETHFRLGKKGAPAACYPFLWNYSSNLAASDSSRAGTISTAHEHHSPTRNGRNEVGFPFVYAYVHIWLDCWPSQFEETPTLATESPQWPFHTVLRWALALLNWFVTGL